MITSKKLSIHSKIRHGFFNKKGGKSKGIYKSLNCGTGSKDKKNNVTENLKIAKAKISKKCENILNVKELVSKFKKIKNLDL